MRGRISSSSTSSKNGQAKTKKAAGGITTLAIDIGGTGLKALLLDPKGAPLTERLRVETPRPATPAAVVEKVVELVKNVGPYDRVSVGFPGVVDNGIVRTAPNLDKGWNDYPLADTLAKRLKKPTRALNDAGVQGFGVIEGKGVEMVLTFGTGMGTALYLDGRYVPNLELAHHPFKGKLTYEDYVDARALDKIGKKKWNKRVARILEQIHPIWNPRKIYLGGGNAKHLKLDLPKPLGKTVQITENIAGLLGGIALWN
jgi:polyphosphate glucokinase